MKEHNLTIHFEIRDISIRNFQGQACEVDVSFHYQNENGDWRSRSHDNISPSSQARLFKLLDGEKPGGESYGWSNRHNRIRCFEISFENLNLGKSDV